MMLKHLSGAAAIATGLCLMTAPAQADYSLNILHINDLHSRILPVNKYDSTCGEEDLAEGKCFGGFARVSKALNDRRAALEAKGGNVLVLDAGDQFQGSLFYTNYKGQAAVELMNMTGFDVMTIGNHEFDDGPDVFLNFIEKANFPIVGANTIAAPGSVLRGKYGTSIVLERGGEKIGIIGALAEDTDETSSPGDDITFFDTANAVQPIVDQMQAQGVNKIILLSHLGVPRDKQVAKQLTGVDVIVGGHSHTLLSNSNDRAEGPYPVVETAPDGKKVPIVQAYAYSKFMGELNLTFDDEGNLKGWSGDTVLLDQSYPEDAKMQARIAELNKPLDEIQKREVGSASSVIDGSRSACRAGECAMANMVADAMLARVNSTGGDAVIALQNGGGVRASIDAGPVTMGEVLTVLPFQNTIATFKLKGVHFIEALENGLSKVEEGAGRFPQLSGARYTWDPKAEPGSRVVSVEVGNEKDGFVALDETKIYSMVTNNYVRNGGDGYSVLADHAIDAYDFGPSLEDALAGYITVNSPVEGTVSGRIIAQE
ncbi:bifunctional metallophosphatase/5'-nucleotidase [Kiloniella majae]|uniref:bifunctional metallophosphatase/5'-nucleotidase n=1 Tax=Kiloniella majae TaxID=1938558 RepID=UPI0021001A1B|nr:bifunctional metallophosphatase/5'-nucleotidase [Kiloniella majae]